MFKKNKETHFKGTYYFQGRNDEKVRERKKRESSTMKRMVGLMSFIVIMIGMVAFRLFYLQISNKDYYDAKLVTYQTTSKTQDVPRGQIYDRNGTLLVKSEATNVIMYYAPRNIKEDEEIAMAKIIAGHFNVSTDDLTIRDLQDMYIRDFADEAKKLISDEEWSQYQAGDIDDQQIYNLKLERITKDIITTAYQNNADMDLKTAYVYTLMNKDVNGGNVIIENASAQDIAFIGENSTLLRGFTYSHDYNRVYPYGTLLKSVFGSVSSKTQGLPESTSNTLLALDYQLNSRVGTSGLEQQYESLLKGNSSTYSIGYDENGNPVLTTLTQGNKGYDLQLSIDWELQQYISQLLEANLKSSAAKADNKYVDRAYFVLMDPNTGEVLAMVGKLLNRETGEIYDYDSGTYLEGHEFGSSVKGATVYTAFKYGIYSAGETIYDEPLYIQGTSVKASWTKSAMGPLDEVHALAKSSNVFMFKLGIALGGGTYIKNGPLNIDPTAFTKLQNGFGELGLGVETGLDVPYEERGVQGGYTNPQSGNILDAVIGQYYTYTPMQMAVYVSTIANGGKRMEPHIVKEAYTYSNNQRSTVYTNSPKVIDDLSEEYQTAFDRIRLGFWTGVNDSSGILTGIKKNNYVLAAKSGTAEKFDEYGVDYPNKALIAFAPYESPRIASSCIVPRESSGATCQNIIGSIYDKYFEKYGLPSSDNN